MPCEHFTEASILQATDVTDAVNHMASCCYGPNRINANAIKASLLRCIFGNPFQKPWCPAEQKDAKVLREYKIFDLDWLTSTVTLLARAIYEERAFGHLPFLADALEEAGITDVQCPHCVQGRVNTGPGDYGDEYGPCSICRGTGRVTHPILEHCRDMTVHARGCWVVDLILGKE